jgi:hypothetical protein
MNMEKIFLDSSHTQSSAFSIGYLKSCHHKSSRNAPWLDAIAQFKDGHLVLLEEEAGRNLLWFSRRDRPYSPPVEVISYRRSVPENIKHPSSSQLGSSTS